MTSARANAAAGLRGAVLLTRDAVLGLSDMVEAMHRQIASPLAGRPAAGQPVRTGGITGLVYGGVRGVTRVVGGGSDVLLAALAAALPAAHGGRSSRERDAIVAALNGVMGDRLVAMGNPLAITMGLRSQGRDLRLQPASLAASVRELGPKPLVMVHGLCMNDGQWFRQGHDHGAALARDLGYTPVYLRYNTGRSVAENGRAFAQLMETLLTHWPVPIREVCVLAHSMGGLVARSAFAQGEQAGQAWVRRLDRMIFLGTPHHGAPLERGGNWVNVLLEACPYSAPLAALAKLRSAGITDLRHGRVLPAALESRRGPAPHDRFARGADPRRPLPLPAAVACYAVATTVLSPGAGRHRARAGQALGDGLVPMASALGQHADPRHTLGFAPERCWTGEGIHHLQLLSSPTVYAQLRAWLAQPASRS